MLQRKTISIIIPAYNEQAHLAQTLGTIANQTVKPDEVIVVDNNSTDKTAEIARSFPFVTVVRELQQGRGHARNAGFNAARGDVLGRINADARLQPDWVERVLRNFERIPRLGGLTGPLISDTIPGTHWGMTTVWSRLYLRWNEVSQHINTLLGGNMAISREAWLAVRDETCLDDKIVHEDQDLAYLLNGYGFPVHRDNALRVEMFGQHFNLWPRVKQYRSRRESTRRWHQQKGTLQRPGALRLPVWVVIVTWIWGVIPAAAFVAASYLRYKLFRRPARRFYRD